MPFMFIDFVSGFNVADFYSRPERELAYNYCYSHQMYASSANAFRKFYNTATPNILVYMSSCFLRCTLCNAFLPKWYMVLNEAKLLWKPNHVMKAQLFIFKNWKLNKPKRRFFQTHIWQIELSWHDLGFKAAQLRWVACIIDVKTYYIGCDIKIGSSYIRVYRAWLYCRTFWRH